MLLRRFGTMIGLLAIAALPHGVVSQAQGRRPMSLVNLAELPRLQDVQLSPDGRFISYQLARADWKANRLVAHLFRQPVSGGTALQLTQGDAGESTARWSPDGRTLLFLSRGESGLQVFLVSADGGPPRQLTRHITGVYGGFPPAWTPDGSAIYFLAAEAQPDLDRERARLRDDLYAFEEDHLQRHLWKVTAAGGIEQRITEGPFSVLSFQLSKDGSRIAAQRAPSPLVEDSYRGEVWTTDALGGAARVLTSNQVEEFEPQFSPDNSRLLFIAEASARMEPYYTSSLFVVASGGGSPRRLLPDFSYEIEHAAWAPDGRSIFVVANMGVHSEIFQVELASERARALTSGDHSIQFWTLSPTAGKMAFQIDEPTRLGDAWTLPLSGGSPIRITGVYDSWTKEFEIPRQEKVSWRSVDGTTVEGLLYYPLGHKTGQRVPLIVQLHGGPQDSDKFGYGSGVLMNYVPVLTGRGYAVFRPNYRGSTGYGDRFLRDVVGNYFKNMHLDVMSGVELLIQRGIVDGDRMGLMGWSAGGHLTNKLLTFTPRFKAASSSAGVANWVSLFAVSDVRAGRTEWFGGLPWGPGASPDTFWNASPLKDSGNIRTPTLFIAGENDGRVPLSQSIEMFRALKANGIPTRLLVAPREGHQWGELRHQLAKANAELEWFERYVMERPYVWERAPGDPRGPDSGLIPQ